MLKKAKKNTTGLVEWNLQGPIGLQFWYVNG